MGYGAQAMEPVKKVRRCVELRLSTDYSFFSTKGQFIMEYVGEVIDEEEKQARLAEGGARHHYTMQLMPGEYIDPSRRGNFARFLNHSCDPNCETQKWDVLGEQRMGLFAKRDIAAGEDLTFDYQFHRSGKRAQKCLCGSKNCRGWLGLKKDKSGAADGAQQQGQGNEDESSSIEEEDQEEPEDVLQLGEDGNTVRPTDKLSRHSQQRVQWLKAAAALSGTVGLVPLLLKGAAIRSAAASPASSARSCPVLLFRNVRKGAAPLLSVLEPEAPVIVNGRKTVVLPSEQHDKQEKRDRVESLIRSQA